MKDSDLTRAFELQASGTIEPLKSLNHDELSVPDCIRIYQSVASALMSDCLTEPLTQTYLAHLANPFQDDQHEVIWLAMDQVLQTAFTSDREMFHERIKSHYMTNSFSMQELLEHRHLVTFVAEEYVQEYAESAMNIDLATRQAAIIDRERYLLIEAVAGYVDDMPHDVTKDAVEALLEELCIRDVSTFTADYQLILHAVHELRPNLEALPQQYVAAHVLQDCCWVTDTYYMELAQKGLESRLSSDNPDTFFFMTEYLTWHEEALDQEIETSLAKAEFSFPVVHPNSDYYTEDEPYLLDVDLCDSEDAERNAKIRRFIAKSYAQVFPERVSDLKHVTKMALLGIDLVPYASKEIRQKVEFTQSLFPDRSNIEALMVMDENARNKSIMSIDIPPFDYIPYEQMLSETLTGFVARGNHDHA